MAKAKEVATIEGEYSREELIAMSGTVVSGSTEFLPGISINKKPEDGEENELPVPSFMVNIPDVGMVYSARKATVEFRPYIKRHRYEKWLNDSKTYHLTNIFVDWNAGEIIDELGGTDRLNKANDEKVKCKHLIFGTVSYDGTTGAGVPHKIVDQPVLLRVGGASFGDVGDLFKELGKDRILMECMLLITPYASGPAYNFKLEWKDLTEDVPITSENQTTFKNFNTEIDVANKQIQNKFKAAQRGSAAPKVDTDANGEYEFVEETGDVE